MIKKLLKDLEDIDTLLAKIELKGESVIFLASARMTLKNVYEDIKKEESKVNKPDAITYEEA